ncbi:glycosyltransferase family 2 protein [Aquabacterium lacunae]|nr:glycosyltransferase family 2 protein [Aquabacterium lacunae]
MPAYNRQACIGSSIDSVLTQTFSDFELLVIDDGSTDGTGKIVESYSDKRIRYYRIENSGVSVARNFGINVSSGDLIFFLDSDDCWHSRYLELQLDAFHRHPSASWAATGYFSVDTKFFPLPDWDVIEEKQSFLVSDLPKFWIVDGGFLTSCVGVRRSVLASLQYHFPPGESVGEDMDLWLRLGEISSLVFTPTKLMAYRTDGHDSITKNAKVNANLLPYLIRLKARYDRGNVPQRIKVSTRLFINHQIISQGRRLLCLGRRLDAVKVMCNAPDAFLQRRGFVTLFLFLLTPKLVREFVARRKSS